MEQPYTIALVVRLSCTDEFDTRVPYVYMELSGQEVESMEAVEALSREAVGKKELKGLARVAVRGPRMVPLSSLPARLTGSEEELEENEYIALDSPIPEEELPFADSRLCCEELHYFVGFGWYAIANDKDSRDIYEANIGTLRVLRCHAGEGACLSVGSHANTKPPSQFPCN